MSVVIGTGSGRRYNSRVILRARELSAAGWSQRKIALVIEREMGVKPCERTISAWLNGSSEEQLARERARQRRSYRRRNPRRDVLRVSEDWKTERMGELRRAGLSYAAVGKVAGVWWGEWGLSEWDVRQRVKRSAVEEIAA